MKGMLLASLLGQALGSVAALAVSAVPEDVQYFISFGDSYSQTGFNITGTKPAPGNPLGNPALPGYTASGGLNWVGFMVSEYNRSTLLSYNFAYGGATTNASLVAPYEPTVLSLIDQVAEFSGSIASHPSYAPWTAENTLVGVWIGVNDVGNSYYEGNETLRLSEIMDSYFSQLQVIYDAGARNFVLLEVPPIYETPMLLNETTTDQSLCRTYVNQYNAMVANRLAEFQLRNAGVNARLINTAIPFFTAINDPTAFGAPNATCYDSDGTTCLWFNNYHPGIAINNLVAADVASAWPEFFVR